MMRAFGLMFVWFVAAPCWGAEIAFEYVDEWGVAGVDTGKFHAVRLGSPEAPDAVEGLSLSGQPRTGRLRVRVDGAEGVAVLLDYAPGQSKLYVDSDGDGRFIAGEQVRRVDEEIWEFTLLVPQAGGERTFRAKVGVAGRLLMYAVRGCRRGMVPTEFGLREALLLDGNGDGLFDLDGGDQICVDMDADGRFCPVTERAPLRPSVHLAGTEFSVAVSPGGDVLTMEVRDRPPGTLVASVPLLSGEVSDISLTLLRDDGIALCVRRLGEPVELPAGDYALLSATLRVRDEAGEWTFSFQRQGRAEHSLTVAAGEETRRTFLTPLEARLRVTGELRPDASLELSVECQSAEGLVLGAATAPGPRATDIPVRAWLLGPDGTASAQGHSSYG